MRLAGGGSGRSGFYLMMIRLPCVRTSWTGWGCCRRFRKAKLGLEDRPLLQNRVGVVQANSLTLLEKVEGLLARMAKWVQYHHPPTLKAAISLAEVTAPLGGGQQLPAE